MPSRRVTVFVFALVALVLAGTPSRAEEGTGHRELAQGREAAARQDHVAALKHFKAALSSLDPAEDGEALAEAWLQFGLTLLNGLDLPESALPAFQTSAGLAKAPSTAWLWASVAAEKLGRAEEAATYKTRALAPAAPVPAPAPEPAPVPEPTVEEAPGEKPNAVQHFFGEAAAQPEPEPVPEEPAAPAAQPEAPAAPDKPKETVDAVQYFFGEKEPAAETAPEAATEEKPPAEM
jgi:tetratricopeptide (TPR) repeat protein